MIDTEAYGKIVRRFLAFVENEGLDAVGSVVNRDPHDGALYSFDITADDINEAFEAFKTDIGAWKDRELAKLWEEMSS
jgi:hypothetical protein